MVLESKIAASAAGDDGIMTLAELAEFVQAAYRAEAEPDHQLMIRTKGLTQRLSRIEIVPPKPGHG
jgi:hypothetical protein